MWLLGLPKLSNRDNLLAPLCRELGSFLDSDAAVHLDLRRVSRGGHELRVVLLNRVHSMCHNFLDFGLRGGR